MAGDSAKNSTGNEVNGSSTNLDNPSESQAGIFPRESVSQALPESLVAPQHGVFMQTVRCISLVIFFIVSSVCIYGTQLVGYPIKYVSEPFFHAWVDFTKQSFGLLLVVVTQYWTPVKVTVSGDKSVKGIFSLDEKSLLQTKIPDRAIVISNHQLYSDWVFLWYIAYTARAHGGIYIMLKDSLKKIPIWGWGMQIYGFIFLNRKWSQDEQVLTSGLQRINNESDWPAWLTLFPEGTTFSRNGVRKSTEYGKKADLEIPRHVLLPRVRGLRKSLLELDTSIEYLYDATIHYSGIPKGVYGEDFFTLRNMYLRGISPSRIVMYWRRIAIKDIPYQDEKEFEQWTLKFWYEKDQMLDNFTTSGKFADDSPDEVDPPVTADVKLESPFQAFQIFSVPLNILLILNIIRLNYSRFFS
ncbi:Cst26p [Sugiyamaella lignohabitans]|uniref:Cst26p n=1 Tax=Sugiyamaella lignohabitans TaxID=796027 RepID=A0A167DUH3_9ASCO|nr:Cst26p [Sugiyamaella lignohabitans]ANB13304.1 Cst26p [Sugiyamaella lignohabitans]